MKLIPVEKYKKYQLKVGDTILVSHCFGNRHDVVTRVTATMAICEGKEKPIRYPREYGIYFYPKGSGGAPTVKYEVFEKKEEL